MLQRLWSDEGMALLKRVVTAKANVKLADAVNTAYQGEETNQYQAASLVTIADARRYRYFLEVLDEIAKENEHFLVTLNQSTKQTP